MNAAAQLCSRPYPWWRLCFLCGRPHYGCTAYVLGRDLLALEDGKITAGLVREMCGRCDLTPGQCAKFLSSGFYPAAGCWEAKP